jgi:serine/threonine protein phosphatase PrpC
LRYETAEISLIGDRDQNQDRVAVAKSGNSAFLVVVDGMGGHAEGERAAEVARRSFVESFEVASSLIDEPASFLADAIGRAHEAVVGIGVGQALERKPRATCAICLVLNGSAWWAHVGDTRVYLVRENKVLERTRDHSHVEVLFSEGLITEEEIHAHPMRHYVECCLGGESALPETDDDLPGRKLESGDTLLVCSDGLWSGLTDAYIGLSCLAEKNVSEWLGSLSERAVASNAPYSDNTTAAALRLIES